MLNSEQIMGILKDYKANTARRDMLTLEQQQLETLLALELGEGKYENVLRAYQYDGIPGGQGFSSPVERWFDELEKNGGITAEARTLKDDIEKIKAEQRSLRLKIGYVDSWLKMLNVKERWVLEQQLIEGRYWWEVSTGFKDEFGYYMSSGGLKKIKRRAFDKICGVTEK